ncbi:VOC family protein [Micromonospora sp. CB01531]|uniref:VOC family protein n=1 Tax=Micromonospora sp. CB01531 TaxID=1718947 RepID=UPI00093D4150|nr:VOC family protein [Micromonospora sp. CB01531]OKI49101.1 glyoxalase [Micromonospora sp. CB01531]
MPPQLKLTAITLDRPDPRALAAFYQQATGLDIDAKSGDDFVALIGDGGLFIGLQRVDDYHAPTWPDQRVPQQLHLDFAVDDLDEAEALVLRLGATKPETEPGGDRWHVFVDPAGHPFCVTRK